ncbi:anti-sigma-28 factor, FlgM family [Lachnospiraceae bacterium XBB1006]|nr:anti-sigma-28 factor, FlgM family [Lachnospiraceae bacterium XBB1006]
MRIDAYNQVRQVYQTQKAAKAKAAYQKTGSYGNADQLQISQTGKDYQIAKQAVAGASEVREDLVAQMKEKVANGSYHVDVEDFASKLLAKYNEII